MRDRPGGAVAPAQRHSRPRLNGVGARLNRASGTDPGSLSDPAGILGTGGFPDARNVQTLPFDAR